MIDGKTGPDEPEIDWDTSEHDDECQKVMIECNRIANKRFIYQSRGGWLWEKISRKTK